MFDFVRTMPPNLHFTVPPYNPYANPRPLHRPEERPSQYATGFYPHPPNPPPRPYHAMSNYHANQQMNRPPFNTHDYNSSSFTGPVYPSNEISNVNVVSDDGGSNFGENIFYTHSIFMENIFYIC
jgi:hypothetical protein